MLFFMDQCQSSVTVSKNRFCHERCILVVRKDRIEGRRTLNLAGKHLHVVFGEVMNHRDKNDETEVYRSYIDA